MAPHMTSLHVVRQYVSAGHFCLSPTTLSSSRSWDVNYLKQKGVRWYQSLRNIEEPIIQYTSCLTQVTVLGLSLRQSENPLDISIIPPVWLDGEIVQQMLPGTGWGMRQVPVGQSFFATASEIGRFNLNGIETLLVQTQVGGGFEGMRHGEKGTRGRTVGRMT